MIFIGLAVCVFLSFAFSLGVIDVVKKEKEETKDNLIFKIDLFDSIDNVNGRIYCKEMMSKAIFDYKKQVLRGQNFIYSEGHVGNLQHAQAILNDINMTDNSISLDIKLLSPPLVTEDMKTFILNHCDIVPVGYGRYDEGMMKFERINGFSFRYRRPV